MKPSLRSTLLLVCLGLPALAQEDRPACTNERLVLVLPELKQAFEFQADGVVDAGQLTVLLSSVL